MNPTFIVSEAREVFVYGNKTYKQQGLLNDNTLIVKVIKPTKDRNKTLLSSPTTTITLYYNQCQD